MNEDQYYNPIIQAMIHTATLQKQGKQQEIEKQKNADDKKLHEQQLAQVQQQIEQAHENQLQQHQIARGHLDIQGKMADMEANMNRFKAIEMAQKTLSGAKPGFQLPENLQRVLSGGGQEFQPQQSRQLPVELGGDQQQPQQEQQAPDLSGLFDPAAKGREEAASVVAKAEAGEPFQIRKENREYDQALKMAGVKSEYDMKHLEAQGEIQRSLADINGRWRLRGIAAAHAADNSIDGDTVKQLTDGVFNGEVDYTKLPIPQKKAVLAYAGANGEASALPLNTPKYKESIDALSSIQPLMESLKNLAAKYSRDSPGSFGKGNVRVDIPLIGAQGFTAPGSTLKSEQDTIAGLAGRFAQFFDYWKGRKSNQEIVRQITGVFDPASSMKDNFKKIADHEKVIRQDIQSSMPKMKLERINKILSDRNIDALGAFGEKSVEYKEGQTAIDDSGKRIIYHNGKWEDK